MCLPRAPPKPSPAMRSPFAPKIAPLHDCGCPPRLHHIHIACPYARRPTAIPHVRIGGQLSAQQCGDGGGPGRRAAERGHSLRPIALLSALPAGTTSSPDPCLTGFSIGRPAASLPIELPALLLHLAMDAAPPPTPASSRFFHLLG
ncbi:hypothetical protein ACP70R_031904 [Stipagrostis hirtigluma subsp. patula]